MELTFLAVQVMEMHTYGGCPSDYGKLATSSDDFTVRVWDIKKGTSLNTRSPTSIQNRVTAHTNLEYRKLFTDDTQSASKETDDSKITPSSPELRTPESGSKRKVGMFLDAGIEVQKSPEASSSSPSSVLNPPPSLKRKTICDYCILNA